MLKCKERLNYKKGYSSRHCSICDQYLGSVQITGIGGVDLGVQARCKVIGTDAGRMYRINPVYVCDKFDNTQYLNRLKRGWRDE
jgi:hypothetical protein